MTATENAHDLLFQTQVNLNLKAVVMPTLTWCLEPGWYVDSAGWGGEANGGAGRQFNDQSDVIPLSDVYRHAVAACFLSCVGHNRPVVLHHHLIVYDLAVLSFCWDGLTKKNDKNLEETEENNKNNNGKPFSD